jgi:predicted lipoprotein with Yx(FWY)xxD motif/polyisoprenoid-binding protein YceI
MKVNVVFSISILILVLVSAVGCSVLQEPQAASESIEAIPLELEATAPPATEVPPTEAPPTEVSPTEAPTTGTPVKNDEPAPTVAPTIEPAEETVENDQGLLVYQIVPGESEVRFELDEVLRGNHITVVGITDQVAGELAVDLNDLSTTQIGTLQINARTLATDNDFRNRAIKNEILNTNEYEFITFTPSAVVGLPESISVGEPVSFAIAGDLTIRDVTSEATFEVEAAAVSEDELSGTANAVIQRADYNLNIPSAPNVANVEEEVELYIDFIAVANDADDGQTTAQSGINDEAGMLLLAEDEALGTFLTDVAGMTLYTFANDEPGVSNCYDQCAENWPPLLLQAGEAPIPGFGITGELGVIERDDETLQVTYNGSPLYYWVNDEAPGNMTGHEVNDAWFVVEP